MSSAAFYKWRAKYGGMDASLMARLGDVIGRIGKFQAEGVGHNGKTIAGIVLFS